MFFKVTLVKELLLEPKDMGRHISSMVHERLKENLEGKLVPNVGFVILVTNIADGWKGSGRLDNSQGAAKYDVEYEAVVFRPFPNEVIDATVLSVGPYGLQCTIAGMLKVFVLKTHFPEDVQKFEREAFVSDDGEVQIRAQCGVRLRILSLRFEADTISGVGTLDDNWLGLLFSAGDEAALPDSM